MSIAKRPSKDGRKSSWQVLIDTRDAVTGKRKRLVVGTFRTKREAEVAERQALDQRDRGTLIDPNKITVGELLDHWLVLKQHQITSQSLADYEIFVRRHLKPAMGAVPVQKLTAAQVQKQYTLWQETGMGARVVRGCHMRLSQALDYAVKHHIVHANVCKNVTQPRLPRNKPDVWDTAEAVRFLEAATGDSLSPLWHLLLLEGMRRGEALGLRWQDINWDRGTAHIVQTVASDKTNHGAPIIQDYTKTKTSARTVRLTAETLDVLRTHRRFQAERQLKAAEWPDHDLILTTRFGTLINPNNVKRNFNAIVERADLRRIRVHDLRHTHATMLLKQGVSAKVVSERLGHATVAITLDTYSHVLPDMQDAAVDAMSAIMGSARKSM